MPTLVSISTQAPLPCPQFLLEPAPSSLCGSLGVKLALQAAGWWGQWLRTKPGSEFSCQYYPSRPACWGLPWPSEATAPLCLHCQPPPWQLLKDPRPAAAWVPLRSPRRPLGTVFALCFICFSNCIVCRARGTGVWFSSPRPTDVTVRVFALPGRRIGWETSWGEEVGWDPTEGRFT